MKNNRVNSIFEIQESHYLDAINASKAYHIPHDYDYSRSTELNYAAPEASREFVGKYAFHRSQLDYSYHGCYIPERQLLHDRIMDAFMDTIIKDGSIRCNIPLENWMVFTAGTMGSGKGHTIKWLNDNDLFPLDAFVRVDPDAIRELLPEWNEYFSRDPYSAGILTQKEVGYISEVLILDALSVGKNVLIDGSLRDAEWYLQYITHIKATYPKIKIAIIHVSASEVTVLARCRARGEITGRHVPEKLVLESFEQIPRSVEVLAPYTNFVVHFENEVDNGEPRLCLPIGSVSHNEEQESMDFIHQEFLSNPDSQEWKSSFKELWKMQCPPTFGRRLSTRTFLKTLIPMSSGSPGSEGSPRTTTDSVSSPIVDKIMSVFSYPKPSQEET